VQLLYCGIDIIAVIVGVPEKDENVIRIKKFKSAKRKTDCDHFYKAA